MRSLLSLAAVAALLAVGAAAGAGEPVAVDTIAADPFAQAMAARAVADFARRQHDVHAMITAARMLQEVPFMGSEGEAGFTPAGLFAEARGLAKGDQMLLMQISVAQSTGSRGVSQSAFGKGLVRSVQTVDPRAGYSFTLKARGGEPLRVGAIGDIGTALTLRLRDPAGRVACLDDHGDYGPVCQVTPKVATDYQVNIVNKSAIKSRAVILSN